MLFRKPPYTQEEIAEQIRQVAAVQKLGDKDVIEIVTEILAYMVDEVHHYNLKYSKKPDSVPQVPWSVEKR